MLPRLLVVSSLLLMSTAVWADSLDLNIHENAFRGIYSRGADTLYKGLSAEAGYFYNDDNDYVANLGLLVSGENWSKGGVFDIGLGGRLVYGKADPGKTLALALGGQLRFSPVHRVGIGGHFFYAPNIVTSMDGERYMETGARIDYQLLPQAFVYVGYRTIKIKFKDEGTVKLDDHGQIGMKLLF